MDFQDIIAQRRTVRLFRQQPVEREKIRAVLHAATQASCGVNRQPLRYIVVEKPGAVHSILAHTRWAALFDGQRTPVWQESAPAVFIVMVSTEAPSPLLYMDSGAAAMSIELAACDQGLGCCWLASFDPEHLKLDLDLDQNLTIPSLLALGYPAETPQSVAIEAGAPTRYYLDGDTLTVPKYTVDAITRWI